MKDRDGNEALKAKFWQAMRSRAKQEGAFMRPLVQRVERFRRAARLRPDDEIAQAAYAAANRRLGVWGENAPAALGNAED